MNTKRIPVQTCICGLLLIAAGCATGSRSIAAVSPTNNAIASNESHARPTSTNSQTGGQTGASASMPRSATGKRLYVYDEFGGQRALWIPEMMVTEGASAPRRSHTINPYAGTNCVQLLFNLRAKGWQGAAWLPKGQWVPTERGQNLHKELGVPSEDKEYAIRLVFYGRSPLPVVIKCKVGFITEGAYPDSLRFPVESTWITLGNAWQRYEIDLSGQDLSCVQGAFCVVADDRHNRANDLEFYLDEIYFEAYLKGDAK